MAESPFRGQCDEISDGFWVFKLTGKVELDASMLPCFSVHWPDFVCGNTTSQGPNDYSHLVEVNSDTDNASSISNREYEERDQDKKRQIQLLNKSLLGDFVAEFDRLIAE